MSYRLVFRVRIDVFRAGNKKYFHVIEKSP